MSGDVESSPEQARDPKWSLNPLLRLQWRDWGGDTVVYDATSGQTHQFDRLTAAVVACIAERPWSVEALCRHLSDAVGDESDSQLVEVMAQVVDRLQVMGWLRLHTP